MQRSQFETSGESRNGLGTAALVGAAVLLALPLARGIARRWRTRHPKAERESAIDKSLEDTYPASDPPAHRYVDIPVNRR
jgi:hypothetical protein